MWVRVPSLRQKIKIKMEKFDNFEGLKNSDISRSKTGKVKNEEELIKFFELLRTNVVKTNINEMKTIKKIKSKQ